ncbi:MAG: hypothetical protein WBD20_02115 [Pirellulaceae bacterium]
MFTIDRHDRNRFLLVLAIALLVRGAVVMFSPQAFAGDPDAYRVIAETLASHGVYGVAISDVPPKPTAFRPPLYPYLLSWLTPSKTGQLSLWAVGFLHTILGALTVVLTVWVASRLIDGGRVGTASLLAGLLVLVDPILVQLSTQVMTETLAVLLSIAVVAWWVGQVASANERRGFGRFVVLSALLAIAYLCRPTFLVWAMMLIVGSFFVMRKIDFSSRLARVVLTASLMFVAIAGWTWRNAQSVGHPIWATSHGGYTLLLANNESFYNYLRDGKWGEPWDAVPFLEAYGHRYDGDPNEAEFWQRDWSTFEANAKSHFASVTEHSDDQRCYHAARATIDRQPMMFVWSCFVRVGRLWSPMPHHSPGRGRTKVIAVGVYYLTMYVAVLVALWRFRHQVFAARWWAIWTLAITLSGVHAVYWTNIRMRAPIIPALAILAAGAMVDPRRHTPKTTGTQEAGDVAND